MVVYIPVYRCIMNLEQIWTNELLVEIHFHFQKILSKCYDCEKKLQKIKFNGGLFFNFYTCKKKVWKITLLQNVGPVH
jgi:hypothetical protein